MNRNKFGRAVVSGLMIATLATCGGGGPSTPTASPSAPPVQQVRTVLGNADFTLLAGRATFKAYDNPPIGMMDVTVDWGNTANQIDVYWTDGRCPRIPVRVSWATPWAVGKATRWWSKPPDSRT